MPPKTVGTSNGSGALGSGPDALTQVQFRVEVTGEEIGRFAECSGLSIEYEVLEYAEGGNNSFVHGLRGRMRYRNVVLRRGVTSEDALLNWFFRQQGAAQRPTLTIAVLDPKGQDVRRFSLAAAYPVRWSGPGLQTGSARSGFEELEVGHEGLVA